MFAMLLSNACPLIADYWQSEIMQQAPQNSLHMNSRRWWNYYTDLGSDKYICGTLFNWGEYIKNIFRPHPKTRNRQVALNLDNLVYSAPTMLIYKSWLQHWSVLHGDGDADSLSIVLETIKHCYQWFLMVVNQRSVQRCDDNDADTPAKTKRWKTKARRIPPSRSPRAVR